MAKKEPAKKTKEITAAEPGKLEALVAQLAKKASENKHMLDQQDVLDAVEFRQAEQDAPAVRHGASGQTGPGASRNHGCVQPLADAHDRLHLFFGFG